MATWYWKDSGDQQWETVTNWWSNIDGTGDNPTTIPWTTIDTATDDLTLSSVATNIPNITNTNINIGQGFSITGTCDISNLIFSTGASIYDGIFSGSDLENRYGWIYSGNFSGPNFVNNGIISGGNFSGDNFTNNYVILAGSFTGSNFSNLGAIYGGTFSGSGFTTVGGNSITGGTFIGAGTTWYWYDQGDGYWVNTANWFICPDGTGINIPTIPWIADDVSKAQNLTKSTAAINSPIILNSMSNIGYGFIITGTCDIIDIISSRWIYSGNFSGDNFTLSSSISGGTFSGSGFINNGYIDGGTFSGDYFTNTSVGPGIFDGTFSGSNFTNGSDGDFAIINNGIFIGSNFNNYGVISNGSFSYTNTYNNRSDTIDYIGRIVNGVFNGPSFGNYGFILGGTFNIYSFFANSGHYFDNGTGIYGGIFDIVLTNVGDIYGGTFIGKSLSKSVSNRIVSLNVTAQLMASLSFYQTPSPLIFSADIPQLDIIGGGLL